jgi:hypothetical protein
VVIESDLKSKFLLQTTCKPLKVRTLASIPVRGFATQEEKRQATVLRYLSLCKFFSLLESGAVWFSRLGALQDKFEATLPLKIRALLEERDRKIAEKFAADPVLSREALTMTARNVDSGRKMFAVNCWYLGEFETKEMWKDYGEDGKGVALRSTVERLSTAFPKMGSKIREGTVIDKVKYVDFDSCVMDEKEATNIDRVAFLRPEERTHEQEVRILTLNIQFNPDHTSIDPKQLEREGLYMKCKLPTLIEAIIVGPNASSHFFNSIEQSINRLELNIPVVKSELPGFED